MKRQVLLFTLLSLALFGILWPAPAAADSSHARIVRLSLVQGDVRFARDFHHDSLTDAKASWEVAPLNLPIRQGYSLATDNNGRAEVEFENGAMAFLNANTVIEFYDLSLSDGALVTRLVLRQGSAIFYVHPTSGDYFSVTGGDFSVEATSRVRFRVDNFDDGSNVSVEQGRVNVLHGSETKALDKGQSYAINLNNDGGTPVIDRIGEPDSFDKWVSGRIDSVATATAYSNNYVNSPGYSAGFADLFTYGSWFNLGGYGYGWQPFGMGLGWSPFSDGNWYYDPFFGWNFIGSAPWGWLPYHYGGWVFNPIYGWVWVPSGFGFGGPVYYRPVTAVWVHSESTIGIVPLHPADGSGRTPLNLGQGIYPVRVNGVAQTLAPSAGDKWSVLRRPSRQVLGATTLAAAPAPTHVSRTILTGMSGSRAVTLSRDSSISYDPGQRRFVNANGPSTSQSERVKTEAGTSTGNESSAKTAAGATTRTANVPAAPPRATVPARPNIAPPRPHTSSGSSSKWGGGRSSGGGSSHSSSSGSAIGSSHASASSGSHGSGGHR